RRKAEIDRLEALYRKLLQDSGVQVFATRATLAGGGKVRAGEQLIHARHILLATGGWPRMPDVPGKELAVSSNEIFDLPRFPDSLLVVGGGYIAVEFASIFSGLGSKVDLSYRGSRLLKHFDEDVSSHFTQQLSRKVELLLRTEVTALARLPDGRIEASFRDGSQRSYDSVLFATGRTPNTHGLGLEHTAVRLGEGGEVLVDAQFHTDEPKLHAIGD